MYIPQVAKVYYLKNTLVETGGEAGEDF